MRRTCSRLLSVLAVLVVLAVSGVAAAALTGPTPERARQAVTDARASGKYAFCNHPRRPTIGRARLLCPLAAEITDCAGLEEACRAPVAPTPSDWVAQLVSVLAAVGKVLVWALVAFIVLAVAYPVVRAVLKGRRDRRVADDSASKPNVAEGFVPPPISPEGIADAEGTLLAANELARAGQNERALGLYLEASLAALDRRGAIRLAKHRTNGEYVRSCVDPSAHESLREIVKEVDRVTFGHVSPTAEAISTVAARATAIVRQVAVIALVLLASGCAALGGGGPSDPAGDDLPIDVLTRSGFVVSRLDRSIASLPMPAEGSHVLLVIDASKVVLEEETTAHILQWVEAGGHMMLLGSVSRWPSALNAKVGKETTVHDLDVPRWTSEARLANPATLDWPSADDMLAILGDDVYAAAMDLGEGSVIGVASSDLFTNVGVARPENAAALVGLVSSAAIQIDTIHVAEPEDGVPPPSNPFTSLARAGLGKGLWHALGATVILFLAYGVRQARAKPAEPPPRRAFAEHVEATGALYGRTKTFPLALASYARFADARLRERLPRGADPIGYLASRADRPRDEVERIWTRAMEARPDDAVRGDELDTISALRGFLSKAFSS